MSSNSSKEESELVAACAAGDAQAWNEFLKRYRRVIRATAGRLRQRFEQTLGDTDDLEHHVYQKLLENDGKRLTAWQRRAKFSTYLVEVTRNLVLDYYVVRVKRHRLDAYRQEIDHLPPQPHVTEDPEWADQRRQALLAALATLSEKQRLIMQLRLEGKTLSEIAAITNRPLGTISVENSRALTKLRTAIDTALAKAEGRE